MIKKIIDNIEIWFHNKKKLKFDLETALKLLDTYDLLFEEIKLTLGVVDNTDIVYKLKELKKDLIYKVTQERVGEILKIKKLDGVKQLYGAEAYRGYLEEAELVYKARPWKDIVTKFQIDQIQYIMRFTDGGEMGNLQQLVSRGGLLFADYAEKELSNLHLKYLELITGKLELKEEDKYKIFTS